MHDVYEQERRGIYAQRSVVTDLASASERLFLAKSQIGPAVLGAEPSHSICPELDYDDVIQRLATTMDRSPLVSSASLAYLSPTKSVLLAL